MISDTKGYFKISSSIGDTIVFSSIQYEKQILVVIEKLLQDPNLEILLTIKMETLNQIHLSSSGLSGNLESDVLSTQLAPYIVRSTYKSNETILKRPISNETIITISIDLGKTINLINGNRKKQKRNAKLQKHKTLINNLISRFPKDFYTEGLGIPEILISDFIFFWAEVRDFKVIMEQKNNLKLIEFLEHKVISYKKQKGLD